MTNPADAVSWVCEHQSLVTAAASWAVASIPLSVVGWVSTKWKACPTWVKALLNALAGNLAHAAEDVVKSQAKPAPPHDPAG